MRSVKRDTQNSVTITDTNTNKKNLRYKNIDASKEFLGNLSFPQPLKHNPFKAPFSAPGKIDLPKKRETPNDKKILEVLSARASADNQKVEPAFNIKINQQVP